jgi:hypothetical protein
MPYFTYDTSVMVSRQLIDLRKTNGLLMSSVVLLELTASAKDGSRRSYCCKRAAVGSGSRYRELGPLQSDSVFLRRQANQGFRFLSIIFCAPALTLEKFFL